MKQIVLWILLIACFSGFSQIDPSTKILINVRPIRIALGEIPIGVTVQLKNGTRALTFGTGKVFDNTYTNGNIIKRDPAKGALLSVGYRLNKPNHFIEIRSENKYFTRGDLIKYYNENPKIISFPGQDKICENCEAFQNDKILINKLNFLIGFREKIFNHFYLEPFVSAGISLNNSYYQIYSLDESRANGYTFKFDDYHLRFHRLLPDFNLGLTICIKP